MHRVAAPSSTLSREESYATQSDVPQPCQLYGGAYGFGGLAEIHPIPLPSLHGKEGSFFKVWFHLMTQLTLNLQWALNLVTLVW